MGEAVPGTSTNTPSALLQAPNAVVIETTEASKQRYRGLTAGPLVNDTWDINPLPCVVVQARRVRTLFYSFIIRYQCLAFAFRSAASIATAALPTARPELGTLAGSLEGAPWRWPPLLPAQDPNPSSPDLPHC